MKRMTIVLAITCMACAFAFSQTPPHPNGGNVPGSSNTPVGGGAPVDGGVSLLAALAAAYAFRKTVRSIFSNPQRPVL